MSPHPSQDMIHRTLRVPKDLWDEALDKATDRNESLSEILRQALQQYIDRPGYCTCGKPATHLDTDPDDPDWACRPTKKTAPAK